MTNSFHAQQRAQWVWKHTITSIFFPSSPDNLWFFRECLRGGGVPPAQRGTAVVIDGVFLAHLFSTASHLKLLISAVVIDSRRPPLPLTDPLWGGFQASFACWDLLFDCFASHRSQGGVSLPRTSKGFTCGCRSAPPGHHLDTAWVSVGVGVGDLGGPFHARADDFGKKCDHKNQWEFDPTN